MTKNGTTNGALITLLSHVIGRGKPEHRLNIAITALEAAREELNVLSNHATHRDETFHQLIGLMKRAKAGIDIEWAMVLESITDLDPAGYESTRDAWDRGEEPPASLAWTLEQLLRPALEEENAIA